MFGRFIPSLSFSARKRQKAKARFTLVLEGALHVCCFVSVWLYFLFFTTTSECLNGVQLLFYIHLHAHFLEVTHPLSTQNCPNLIKTSKTRQRAELCRLSHQHTCTDLHTLLNTGCARVSVAESPVRWEQLLNYFCVKLLTLVLNCSLRITTDWLTEC